jgi:amidase
MVDTYTTARAMIADLKSKRVSARELLDAHVSRNASVASSINAVVATDLVRAQRDAEAIDAARARGAVLGPLAGIPMTVKDGLDVENLPAASGNPAYIARSKGCIDAAVVADARKAGAVIWGKTNVPFMLGDFQSYNTIYGTTNNPHDLTRVPGGSSGGCAAALASGITPLEIGTDFGGSLRHPTHCCGVTALKPTWGTLSARGHIPPEPESYVEVDLGVVGPMARTIDDLKLFWSVLRGTPEQLRREIKGACVAIWDTELGWPLAGEVKAGIARAAGALARAGAHVERTKPKIDGSQLMSYFLTILTAILSAGMPVEMIAAFETTREADRKLVASGGPGAAQALFRLRANASYREILRAGIRRRIDKERLAEFFGRYDAIVMPVAMVPAFPHVQDPGFNERMLDVDGRKIPYPALLNWIAIASVLHVPALAVPAAVTAEGLPVGVQILGPWNAEDRLFDFAAVIEEASGGFRRPASL